MDPVALALILLGVVLNVGAQVALKYSVRPAGADADHATQGLLQAVLAQALNPWVVLAVFLYFLSFVNWRFVLARMDMGIAYPSMSLAFIPTFLLGWWLFNEPMSPTRIVGIVVIIAGVYLLFRPA